MLVAQAPERTAQAHRIALPAGNIVGEHLNEELHRTQCYGSGRKEWKGLTPGDEGLHEQVVPASCMDLLVGEDRTELSRVEGSDGALAHHDARSQPWKAVGDSGGVVEEAQFAG